MATELFIVEIRARGANKVARQLKKINAAALAARKTMALFRNALVAIAAIRLFGGIIKQIANFDLAMQTIKAITGATAQEFIKLEAEARKLGATTKFTASEAAEGMLALGRAGFSTAEILQASAHTLDLAIVGAIELGKASEITAGTLRGFGLEAVQTERVVDIMTFTAQKSLNTISDLGESFKLTAPIAGQLGVTIEELASQFVILGQNNVRASLAGTALRRVMLNLESPGGTLLKTLQKLKIPLDEVRISSVGLSGAMKRLKEAGLGVSDAGQLFGLRGAVAFAIMSDLAGDATEFKKAMDELQGTTKDAADIIEDSLMGALDRTRSAAEALNIEFFRIQNSGLLRDFFEGLAGTLRFLAGNLDDIITAFKLTGVALLVFAVQAGIVSRAVIFLMGKLGALFGLMIANPVTALAIGLTAAVIALVAFQDEVAGGIDDASTWNDVWRAAGQTMEEMFGPGSAMAESEDSFFSWGQALDLVTGFLGDSLLGLLGIFNVIPEAISIMWDLVIVATKRKIAAISDLFAWLVNAYNMTIGKMTDTEVGTGLLPDSQLLRLEADVLVKEMGDIGDRLLAALFKPLDLKEQFEQMRAVGQSQRFRGQGEGPPAEKVNKENKGGSPLGDDLAKEIAARERLRDALKSLEAAFFPVIAMREKEKELLNIIDDARQKGIMSVVNERELVKRAMRAHLGLGISLEQLEEQYKVLSVQRAKGNISIEEEIMLADRRRLTFLNNQQEIGAGIERFFLKRKMEAQDAATQIETVMTNAFKGAEDALHEFVTTGKADFGSLVDSIISDIARMAIKMATSSIFESILGGGIGVPGGITGQSNGAQSLFDSIGSGNFLSTLGGLFSGAAHGGSFRVGSGGSTIGNLPGTDNRLVAFAARDGEEVHVTQKSDAGGSSGVQQNINFNITTPNADSFMRSQTQISSKMIFAGQAAAARR